MISLADPQRKLDHTKDDNTSKMRPLPGLAELFPDHETGCDSQVVFNGLDTPPKILDWGATNLEPQSGTKDIRIRVKLFNQHEQYRIRHRCHTNIITATTLKERLRRIQYTRGQTKKEVSNEK